MSQKTVTIVGAGKLGSLIVDELLKRGAAVRVLARTPGKIAAKPGVDVVAFDALTATDGEVEAALRNSWAVVSSLQGGREVIINAQTKLVHAARKVGARRFISSTFSCNIFTAWPGDNINTDIRRQFADSVDALHADGQFEVVHVSNGVFVDAGVWAFLGFLSGSTLSYYGDNPLIEFTSWEDTAKYTAAAALDPRPVPSQLMVRGDALRVGDIPAVFAAHGRQVALKRLGSVADCRANKDAVLHADPANFMAYIPLMYQVLVFSESGLLGELHNGLYPDIKPESLADCIKRGAV